WRCRRASIPVRPARATSRASRRRSPLSEPSDPRDLPVVSDEKPGTRKRPGFSLWDSEVPRDDARQRSVARSTPQRPWTIEVDAARALEGRALDSSPRTRGPSALEGSAERGASALEGSAERGAAVASGVAGALAGARDAGAGGEAGVARASGTAA